MEILEEHKSPDGLLTLQVVAGDDGLTTIGFAGLPWHTHAEILASVNWTDNATAVKRFVEEMTGDRETIVVAWLNGKIQDAWPTDDPEKELDFQQPGETLEFRLWSGAKVLIDEEREDA
ncbi:MAG: hypothetical protein L6R28_09730 [Planctomycetes bacterium]|nr:hypothetical protein [Planctomycetota bacterium]